MNRKRVIDFIKGKLKTGELEIGSWGTRSDEQERLNKDALELIKRLITDYEKGIKTVSEKELVLNMGNTDDEQKLDELFADKIKRECSTGDRERDHGNADGTLCELLDGLGFTKTVEAFTEVEKYYS